MSVSARGQGDPMSDANDEYQLYDLRIEVISSGDGRPMVCKHRLGDYFTVTDDDLITIPAGMHFPMFPLATLLPLLPAKQRPLSKNDWMYTDTVIACPDPYCGGRFRITRGELRTYRHSEQTLAPLNGGDSASSAK